MYVLFFLRRRCQNKGACYWEPQIQRIPAHFCLSIKKHTSQQNKLRKEAKLKCKLKGNTTLVACLKAHWTWRSVWHERHASSLQTILCIWKPRTQDNKPAPWERGGSNREREYCTYSEASDLDLPAPEHLHSDLCFSLRTSMLERLQYRRSNRQQM